MTRQEVESMMVVMMMMMKKMMRHDEQLMDASCQDVLVVVNLIMTSEND